MNDRRWSLARRLKTWFALVGVLPLLIASAVGAWFLQDSVSRELDALVHEELEEAQALLLHAANPEVAFGEISGKLARHHPTVVLGWRLTNPSTGETIAVFGDERLAARLPENSAESPSPMALEGGVLWASCLIQNRLLLQLALDGAVHTGALRRYGLTVLWMTLASLAVALAMAHVLAAKVSGLFAQIGHDLREHDEPGDTLALAPDEIRECAEELRTTLRRIREHGDQTRLFMASLAHELRSPIQNLIGRADVTLMRTRDEATYREALTEQLEELAEFGIAVDNFLSLCAADNLDETQPQEAFDLKREMELRMQREQRRASRMGVRLDIGYAGETGLVGDREAVLRAVRNVIANAVDWSEEGSEVRVRVQGSDPVLNGEPSAGGELLVLTVDDQGPGIPEVMRDEVFLPFRQNPGRDGRRSGFGLGLAITKKAVEAQGGRIEISTSPLGGARFRLVFPRPVSPSRTCS
jgi:signal transduction histidine kinase